MCLLPTGLWIQTQKIKHTHKHRLFIIPQREKAIAFIHSDYLCLCASFLTSPDLSLQEHASSSDTVCFTSGLLWVSTSLLSVHATFCLSHRARSHTTFYVVVSRNMLLLSRRPEKETPCHKKLYWTPQNCAENCLGFFTKHHPHFKHNKTDSVSEIR